MRPRFRQAAVTAAAMTSATPEGARQRLKQPVRTQFQLSRLEHDWRALLWVQLHRPLMYRSQTVLREGSEVSCDETVRPLQRGWAAGLAPAPWPMQPSRHLAAAG